MKKTYETPALNVEQFDVEDVITASGLLDTVGSANESPIDIGDLSNLNSAPGQD